MVKFIAGPQSPNKGSLGFRLRPELPDDEAAVAAAAGVAADGAASSGGASAAFGVARTTWPVRRRGCGQSAPAPLPAGWRYYCS